MRGDSESDYYAELGVPRHASTLEIRRAYRRLARQHHPDHHPGLEQPARFVALARAYEVLNDPARRADYDHTLAATSDAPTPAPPSPTRPAPRDARIGVRGIIELTPVEAQHLARRPLVLADELGATMELPAGIGPGDEITVMHRGRLARLRVQVQRKT
jgi:curved DNA-binding protein CbpA